MAKQTSKPADSMVTIEFTKNAQLRGRGYFRGNRIQVDAATADAYCRVEQAVLVSELDAANDDDDAKDHGEARRKSSSQGKPAG